MSLHTVVSQVIGRHVETGIPEVHQMKVSDIHSSWILEHFKNKTERFICSFLLLFFFLLCYHLLFLLILFLGTVFLSPEEHFLWWPMPCPLLLIVLVSLWYFWWHCRTSKWLSVHIIYQLFLPIQSPFDVPLGSWQLCSRPKTRRNWQDPGVNN